MPLSSIGGGIHVRDPKQKSPNAAGQHLGTVRMTPKVFGTDITETAEGLKQAELAKNIKPQGKKDAAVEKIKLVQGLKAKFKEFKAASETLRGQTFSSTSGKGIFYKRDATVTSNNPDSAPTMWAAVEDPDTFLPPVAPGQFNFRVRKLATTDCLMGTLLPSSETALGLTGSLTLNMAGATSATVNVNNTMTAAQVVARVNHYSPQTKVSATLITTQSGSKIQLQAMQEGKAIILDSTALTDAEDYLPVQSEISDKALGARQFDVDPTGTQLDVVGDLTIRATDGLSRTVALTATMTLDDIITAINAVTGDTKVIATKMLGNDPANPWFSTDDGAYTPPTCCLVLTTETAGEELRITKTGWTDDLGVIPAQPEEAYNIRSLELQGEFDYVTSGGILSCRCESNLVKAFVPNLVLNLTAANMDVLNTVSIRHNVKAMADGVQSFVDKFNEMKDLLNFHLTPESDLEPDEDGNKTYNLYGEPFVRELDSVLKGFLMAPRNLTAEEGDPTTLMDVGLTFSKTHFSAHDKHLTDRGGKLIFNADKFSVKAIADLESVQALFDLTYVWNSSNNTNFTLLKPCAAWDGSDLTVVLTRQADSGADMVFTATLENSEGMVNADVVYDPTKALLIIKGAEDTIFHGLSLSFPRVIAEAFAVSHSETGVLQNSVGSTYQLLEKLTPYFALTGTPFDRALETKRADVTRQTEIIQRVEKRAEEIYEHYIEALTKLASLISQMDSLEDQLSNMLDLGGSKKNG